MLLVIGSVLLVIALVLLPVAILGLRRWRRQQGLARIEPAALAARTGQRVTLTGVAAPGPAGAVTSGLAGVECVWHGHEVLRHYIPLQRDGAVQERTCDSIADYGSEELFGLVAEGRRLDGDRIFVDPRDAPRVRDAELCLKRVVGRPQPGVASPADDLLPRVRGRISGVFRGETIEFEYREWVVRPGSRVRVTGELSERDGRIVLTAPRDGSLTVEHGVADRTDHTSPRRREALLLNVACVVCALSGILLVLLGL
ncbi:GIDE domain-containing protein [Nocardiopsis lambiniae]|uniref:RING-type E3 ubiquitin transferase n=1 Tax=Nocardiopsis lambiniae TaxID=3075539 RepID=A0ABU2M6H2_9ACTN|nr:GIDE domain-containing protein [Nocardiopsis sp. DSM 44743]MDT0328264.1 GIDE domain-containing protein [Nocardiopsis sp. DSM 44743]